MEETRMIDLHMHSTVSDGSDSPAQLLERVRETGLQAFALTDHDAIKGCAVIRGLLREGDPAFINGAEFSCRDKAGKYHILGLGYDPGAEAIVRLIDEGHGLRMKKLFMRLDFLREKFGIVFPEEEMHWLLAQDNPGKPHIGNLMVKYGFAPTKEIAINEFINRLRIADDFLRPEQAISAILDSGGIPVLAHPSYGDGDQLILGEEMDRRLRRLMGFGLQGVEAFYSGFTKKITREMLDFARRYDLYVSAGSDYHGKNKMIALGDNGLAGAEELPEGLRRLLRDVKKQ